jgi:hypothetical protein
LVDLLNEGPQEFNILKRIWRLMSFFDEEQNDLFDTVLALLPTVDYIDEDYFCQLMNEAKIPVFIGFVVFMKGVQGILRILHLG